MWSKWCREWPLERGKNNPFPPSPQHFHGFSFSETVYELSQLYSLYAHSDLNAETRQVILRHFEGSGAPRAAI